MIEECSLLLRTCTVKIYRHPEHSTCVGIYNARNKLLAIIPEEEMDLIMKHIQLIKS